MFQRARRKHWLLLLDLFKTTLFSWSSVMVRQILEGITASEVNHQFTDDEYHLNAGAVCLPGFWRLREKFGMSLDTLHFEAKVPHYGAKLQKSMNRFFKTMTPEKPVTRNNVSDSIVVCIGMIAD